MKRPIYLDYAATTPVDPRVAAVMMECLSLEGDFGNPASNTHHYGFSAKARIDLARDQMAEALCIADPREIILTSGATESNNLAIKGVMLAPNQSKSHMVTMLTEHKAVLDPARYLMTQDKKIDFLKPEPNGLLDLDKLEKVLKNNQGNTALVSMMWVNNETGVIQDILKIGALVKSHGAYFHVDAAQAVGKLKIELSDSPIDLLSLSAHKFYGPKGIGALYVKRKPKVILSPLLHGGGHENGLRSGTLSTHQIAGMGLALSIASKERETESKRLAEFKKLLWNELSQLSDVFLNGSYEASLPGILNLRFEGVDSESLIMAMEEEIAVSAGSACTSATMEASHVLSAMGLTDHQAHESIRISFGRFTAQWEIEKAIQVILKNVQKLRDISP